ncbi:MAG: NADH-quinone oxidoreductase subunit NuoH [Bdellovibrio sp.]|nr:NADH-quinone oxidoreductase subunit NuoH [Bdellovibrio sp.]
MNETIVSYLGETLGYSFNWAGTLAIFFIASLVLASIMALIGGLGTYAERKISADIQMRYGPNRVGPYGILQFLADGVKMLLKEDCIPRDSDRFIFKLSPMLCLVGVLASLAVLPTSSGFILANLNVGIFYLLGATSVVGVGIFLGGYSSNSKWAMLGGMRGAAQIISYEVPVTLTILSIVLIAGGLSMNTLVGGQGAFPNDWYIFHNPFSFIGFFVYFIGSLAETNRAPFDIPEAESELVSGYHTEFSGMRFAFFALSEYIEVFVLCAIAAALFLGGYNIPFGLQEHGLLGQLLQLAVFFTKSFFLYYVVIWIRWTLPRMRVDHLMILCWKYLTPIALLNLVGTAVWMYCFDGKSFYMILKQLFVASGQ